MALRSLLSNKSFLIRLAFLFTVISAVLWSCRPDKDEDPDQVTPGGDQQPKQATPVQLDLPIHFGTIFPPTLPSENALTEEGIALGKKLFFERKLSINNQLSCAGCHKPQSAFNDPGLAFSLGAQGQLGRRNAMPLFNLAWVKSFDSGFNWDGSAESLEEQAFEPVRNHLEMMESWPNAVSKLQNDPQYPPLFERAFGTNTIDSNLVVKALAQFERTLVSGDSKIDRYVIDLLTDTTANPPEISDYLTPSEVRGFNVYVSVDKGDCFHCHGNVNLRNPLWTDNAFRNNGLDANPDSGLAEVTKLASDLGKFKTPSLRNLVYTAPYMHDGRFQTLEEVVEFYSTGVQANSTNIDPLMSDRGFVNPNLSTQEKADLVAFLKTITDTAFVNNPDFRP